MSNLPLDPGQLNHRLLIEAFVQESDGQGGSLGAWAAISEVWARIEPVSAPVFTDMAGGERAVVTHRILIRHRHGISAGQRFRKASRSFLIRLLRDPDEGGLYLSCLCEEEAQ